MIDIDLLPELKAIIYSYIPWFQNTVLNTLRIELLEQLRQNKILRAQVAYVSQVTQFTKHVRSTTCLCGKL